MRLAEVCLNNSNDRWILVVWRESVNGWVDVSELFKQFSDGSFVFEFNDFLLFDETFMKRLRDVCVKYDQLQDKTTPVYQQGKDFDRSKPPIKPSKILCVGLNYADHAKEFGDALPSEPVIFNKVPSSLNCCGGCIETTSCPSDRVDYEGELVVVIGKTARNVAIDSAMDYVAGYCCGNDVSARDWQKDKPAGQWLLGKSFDSFAPIGPCFVSADEVDDPNNLKIETRLNGQVVQSSNTSCFIFKIDRLLSYVSRVMSLQPGDILFTGTPNGVGDARIPPLYLKKDDKVVVEIEKVGTLVNWVR